MDAPTRLMLLENEADRFEAAMAASNNRLTECMDLLRTQRNADREEAEKRWDSLNAKAIGLLSALCISCILLAINIVVNAAG